MSHMILIHAKRRGMGRTWLVACTFSFALAGCTPKTDSSATPAPPQPVTVTVAPVAVRPVQRAVAAVGTLAAFEDVTLAPKVDGRVIAIRADVGDLAVPGTVLLDLDPTDYELAAAEARQALAHELAKLGLTELPRGEIDVELVPAVKRATVGQEDAERRYRIKKQLFEKDAAASKDEFELAETEMRLAQATKTHAVTEARAVAAAARLRKAALDTAEQKLRDCQLTVPTPPGWAAWAAVTGPAFTPLRYAIAERLLSEGVMVRAVPVTNAYRLVIDHVLKLRAAIPERFEPEVRVGQDCTVTVDAYPGVVFPGRVARKYPTIDPLNRTFQAEVAVPNATGKLRVGGFAKVAVQTRLDPAVIVVPPEAVVTFAGVNKVFLIEGTTAKAVEIQVGMREREWVEVIGDVPAGAKVVTSGQTQLVDGSAIRVRDEAAR